MPALASSKPTLCHPIGLVSTLLLCAGCAAPTKPIPAHVPPSAGQTAKLMVRGAVASGDRYAVFIYSNSEQCAGPTRVGNGDSSSHPASTVIAANRVTTVEFLLSKPDRAYCFIQFTLTPLAGKSYLLSGSSVDKGCTARVLDATDPDQIKPAPAVLRRNPANTNCLPISQSKAMSTQEETGQKPDADAVLRQGASSDDLKGLMQR